MLNHFRPALVLLLGFSILTGVVYPLAITGVAQLTMPKQSAGSLIVENGAVIGSSLIGQSFVSEKYFHGRPSAAGTAGYDASSSSGSNYGPTSQKLHERIAESLAVLKAENPKAAVPGELVYASASGLDPDISPTAAEFQIPRLAKARGVTTEQLQTLIEQNTGHRALGFLGEPTVNVLAINRALDALAPAVAAAPVATPESTPAAETAAQPTTIPAPAASTTP